MKKGKTNIQLSEYFKSLSHPKRIEILFLLKNNQMCVDEIAKNVGLSQSRTSQHLALMRKCKILNHIRHGKKVFYKLSSRSILFTCELIRDNL